MNGRTRKMVVCAFLAAASAVLMFLDFSVPFAPSFLKLDFSDLPALLASFALGPWWGAAAALIKNIINVMATTTAGAGELANFILSSVFTVTAGYIYKHKKTKLSALLGCIISSFLMAAVGIFTNYFLVYPMYSLFMPYEAIIGMYKAIFPSLDTLLKCILFVNVPFTLLKAFMQTAVAMVIYKPLSPVLKGKN